MSDENPSVDTNPAVATAAAPAVEATTATAIDSSSSAPAVAPAETLTPTSAAVAAIVAAATGVSTPGAGPGTTGTMTPALDPEQIENSLKVSLADLSAKATALYAHKQYEEAAEVFAQAAEMQAEINGEMNPANAEILFLYGRSLYKVGQSKSDVFGGKVPDRKKKGAAAAAPKKSAAAAKAGEKTEKSEEASEAPAAADAAAKPEEQTPAERITEEGIAIVAAQAGGAKPEETVEAKKPLFKFEGDENWDDSEEEQEEAGEAEAEGEEDDQDDLAVAFEILEMARVLFNKKLEEGEAETTEAKGKEKDEGDSPSLRHVKERLADTHDLLAELSLEAGRYHDAIPDSRKSLEYKKSLFPQESEVIAEAHFKLSLALEFASVHATDEEKETGVQPVDEKLRAEASEQLEAAIASTKLKLQGKEVELATNHSPEDNDVTRRQIADVKEVIADMEQRLVDLRDDPMDLDSLVNGPEGNPLGGILSAALGESQSQMKARIDEAKKTATDLTGLVRKKVPKADVGAAASNGASAPAPAGAETNGNGKRKLEEAEPEAAEESKKARVEDAVAAEA